MKTYAIRCPFCGASKQKSELLLKLQLLFKNIYVLNCDVCHKKSTWLYIFHLRHDSTNKEEQVFNKSKIWESRIR